MKLAAILAGANAMNMPMNGTPVLTQAMGPAAMPPMNMNMLLPLLLGKDGGMDSDLMMMMMLGGGMGGAGGMGGMNPLMLSLLFKDDEIKSYSTYEDICNKVTDPQKNITCKGNLEKIYDNTKKAIEPCEDACKQAHKDIMDLDSSSSGLSDMLPFLLMSQGGMAGGMNSMLPLILMNKDGDNKDLLMMMMLSQGGMGGGMGGINPLMLSLLN